MASEAPLTKWKSRSVLITLDEDEENRFIQSAPNLNERDWLSLMSLAKTHESTSPSRLDHYMKSFELHKKSTASYGAPNAELNSANTAVVKQYEEWEANRENGVFNAKDREELKENRSNMDKMEKTLSASLVGLSDITILDWKARWGPQD